MKKILSIALSVAIVLSTFMFAITPYAKGITVGDNTEADIDKATNFCQALLCKEVIPTKF